MEQLASRAVVEHHDVVLLGFEEFLHLNQEGKGHLLVDLALIDYQLCLSLQFYLLHELGGVELAVSFVPAEVDLAEAAHPDALQYFISLQAWHFLILIGFEYALKGQITAQPALSDLEFVVS